MKTPKYCIIVKKVKGYFSVYEIIIKCDNKEHYVTISNRILKEYNIHKGWYRITKELSELLYNLYENISSEPKYLNLGRINWLFLTLHYIIKKKQK